MKLNRMLLSLAVCGLMVLPGAALAQSKSGQSDSSKNPWTPPNQSATSNQNASSKLTSGEQQFMKKAAQDDLAEVELGKLAQQKASASEVKQFAQEMSNQHQQNLDKLKDVAQEENVQLPTEPNAQASKEKQKLDKLSGKQFDQRYTAYEAREHKQDIATFQRAERTAKDPALKSYISQTLPTLKQHEHMAMQAEKGKPMSSGKNASSKGPSSY